MVDAHPLPVAPTPPTVAPADMKLPDLTRAIKDKVAQITSHLRTSVACAIETGALLIAAKKKVGHGNFEAWVANNCELSPATARRWMELAEKRPELEKQLTAKTLNLSDLNLSSARRLIAPPTPAQPSEPKRKPEKPKTERYKSIENDLIACLKDLREKAESYAAGTIEALKETVEDQKSPDRAGTGEADAVGESGDAEKVWMEPTLQCDWCRTEFAPKKWWARFCSLKCRNGFHSHERKARRAFLNAASTKEIAGLRKRVDGNAIVSALIGRAYAVAEQLQLPEINGNGHADFVEENAVAPAVAPDGWRRRAL